MKFIVKCHHKYTILVWDHIYTINIILKSYQRHMPRITYFMLCDTTRYGYFWQRWQSADCLKTAVDEGRLYPVNLKGWKTTMYCVKKMSHVEFWDVKKVNVKMH